MGLLEGRVAVITGAGRGIGRAEALLFAAEGARIIVNDTGGAADGSGSDPAVAATVVEEITGGGGQAFASAVDVAQPEGAASVVAAAVQQFGHIDILVNNAGIVRDRSLLEMSHDQWSAVIDGHLTATYLCTQAAARRMVEQGHGGRIVNTTSVAGLRGNYGQANCSAAKAGIYGLTRTSAIELQKHAIVVNALAPVAATRLTAGLPSFEGQSGLTSEHVAPAALFLASELCGDRSGQVLGVGGGRVFSYRLVETLGQHKDEGAAWTAQEVAEHWDAITK